MTRCSLYGTHTGVNLARKHIGWYTKGLPGSAEFRNMVNQQDDPASSSNACANSIRPGWRARRPDRAANCVFYATRPC
jgi:tRNA-dihydrouridine synthase